MGEYAMYNGERVKIGTCESMYYLRADQATQVGALEGNVDPVADADGIRFRFPFPDEDSEQPGGYPADFERGLTITGMSVPEGMVDHRSGHDCAGACPRIEQQAWRGGKVVTCARCSVCGAIYRMPELEHVLPVLEWIATQAERSIVKPDQARWLLEVARRIRIGYELTSWPIAPDAFKSVESADHAQMELTI